MTPGACRSAWARVALAGGRRHRHREAIIAKGRKIAAHLLEAAETDIEFKEGKFTVAGTDRSKTFAEVALTACVPHNYPLDKLEPGSTNGILRSDQFHFPPGPHLRSRDRSRDRRRSGRRFFRLRRFRQHHHPMIVEGQVHGGVAQASARRCSNTAYTTRRAGSF